MKEIEKEKQKQEEEVEKLIEKKTQFSENSSSFLFNFFFQNSII